MNPSDVDKGRRLERARIVRIIRSMQRRFRLNENVGPITRELLDRIHALPKPRRRP